MGGEWRAVSLGDLFKIKHGFAFKGEYFTDQPSPTVLVTPGNFAIGGGFQDQKRKYYQGPVPEDYVLKPGQIVVTMTDLSKQSDTLGHAARIPKDSNIWLHNQRVGLLVFNSGSPSVPRFIEYLLRSREYRSWVVGSATGTTVKHTSPGRIESYRTRVPPLPEQRAIASILGGLDDKIDLNRRMNETLEAMARALFKDWFLDFGPTRAKLEGREPYLAPDLWAMFPDRLDDEGKPEGWEDVPFSSLVSIIGGGTPKTSVDAYWSGSVPWFSVVDTPPTGSVFVTDTEKKITEAGLQGNSARLVPVGTTIISARGTVGNLAVAGQPMTFNQSCYGLHGAEPVGDYFVYLASQQMVGRLQSMAHGSVFSTITRQTFDSITFARTEGPLLRSFENSAAPLFARILSGVRESKTLAQTRDLLLPQLMSGEIRVREAERMVEEVV